MEIFFTRVIWLLCLASYGFCKDIDKRRKNDEELNEMEDIKNFFPYPDLLGVDDLPVASDGSGLDDEEFHNFVGQFVLLPNDEPNDVDNPFEVEHKVEDPHSRAQVSYTADGTKVVQYAPNEHTTETSSDGKDDKSSKQQNTTGNQKAQERNQNKQDLTVSIASDGTKIIQHAITTAAPTQAAAATKPPAPTKSSEKFMIGVRYPKPNTTKVKYMLDGTRITQFNTGIREDNGTKEGSWLFLPHEHVPGFSDNDGQPNAAGYKYRARTGEEEKGSLIKQQIKEAVKENNPDYQIDKEQQIVSSLENSAGNGSSTSNTRSAESVAAAQNIYADNTSMSMQARPSALSNITESNSSAVNTTTPVQSAAGLTVQNETKAADIANRYEKNNSYNYAASNSVFYNVQPISSRSHTRTTEKVHRRFDNGNQKAEWKPQLRRTHNQRHIKIHNNITKNHLKHFGSKRQRGTKLRKGAKKMNTSGIYQMPEAQIPQQATTCVGNNESKLRDTLRSLYFKNEPGVVQKKQNFAYISQCGLYTEPQNVSVTQHAWATKIYSPYFYLYEKPKNYETCKASPWMNGTDMRGSVFISFEVKSIHGSNMENNAKICQKYCCKEPRCSAWVMRKQSTVTANCPKDSFCCWLKTAIPTREPNEDAVSGIVHRESYRHPPTGMRSSVPLGGLGAGSFELRADGTFHEWTIENQSPGSGAKLSKTALDLMLLAIRVEQENDHTTRVLRTHAPHGFEGVEKMTYQGNYPVSKLDIEVPGYEDMGFSLYAYSTFKPRDPKASAVPSVAFSLDIENPTDEDTTVSFMLNLPLGYNDDTIRKGGNYAEVAFTRLVTATDCMNACAKQSRCMSWTTNGPFSCLLKDIMPLNSYEFGIISGVKGTWSATNRTLKCTRPGFYTHSGEIALRVVGDNNDQISVATANDPEILWRRFKKTGTLGNNTFNSTALHGAASIKAFVPAGKSRTVTIIMSWYLPNRGVADERVGNYYSTLFKSVNEVNDYMELHLAENIMAILNWQKSVVPPKSIFPEIKDKSRKDKKPQQQCDPNISGVNALPECLQDILMNSLSFWRSGMWMENGRWRQWEAFDCLNLDPVHVDFHRFLPYVIFFPELAKNVMRAWADHQLIDGMIQESLSMGCLEDATKDGTSGGRPMTDVNVAFVVQTYLIYSWTNDTKFFDELYPSAMRALHWLMKDATHGTDLPYRKPDTYDLFELDKYDHCMYNSVLLKLALRAGEEMALLKGDAERLEEIGKAFDRAHVRLEVEMWDDNDGYYHAWFDEEWGTPSWLMADSLYGQVWAYTLGFGDLMDKEKIKSHLLKERENNDTPYGLKVISKGDAQQIAQEDTSIILGEEPGCKSLENVTKYESVWMSASTDWSTLELHLGMSPRIAMHQVEKSLDHYRSTLKDQWNFHGITSAEHYGLDGLPWATSHYTLHLVLWHLPLALSGQQYYAPNATLTFMPKYDVPYWLPFYTPHALGNIEAKYTANDKQEVLYKLTITSGEILLRELWISNSKYGRGETRLSEGQSVSWSAPSKTKDPDVRDYLSQLR